MAIQPSGLGQLLKRAYPFLIASLVISPIAQFVVFPAKTALATDNCTASLYGTSDSVTGSSATSSQTAVEVGVQFTPAFATTATAVRFYRSVADTGGYTVHLWDSSGNLLGSGMDATATGTGWISINLDSPVSLTAGTTYISSYHAVHGQDPVSTGANSADGGNTMISTPPSAGVLKYDTGATGTTDAINASADTYVTSNNTTTNYGTATELKASNSANRAFLRFNTNGVAPTGTVVTGATLKIYITTTGSTGGVQVHPEDDSWTESSVTWNNQPTWSSSIYATSSTPSSGSWITISLPANAVNGSGNTSLGLSYSAANVDNRLASREDTSHVPQLTVNYAYNTAVLNPSADTYVDSGNTSTNYGTANPLAATSSVYRSFLRFSTNGTVPSGSVVTGATLKLHVTNDSVSSGGFEIHPEDDSWTESGATWSNQPTWSSTIYATSTTPTTGSWISIDLPASAITTSGNTSLGVRYTAANSNASFSSRESDIYQPQLTVNYAPTDTNTSTLLPTADTYVNSNATTTNYATTTPVASSPSTKRSLLRFNTSGVVPSGKTLASATLKLYVTAMDTAGSGYEVHPEIDTWTETGTTWANQPTWDSTVLATSGTPTAGSWLSITLPTSAVNTSGNTSLATRYTVSGSNAYFSSRENVPQAPQLVLNYTPTTTTTSFTSTSDGYYVSPVLTVDDTTAPPAPTGVTPSVGPNSVTLNWDLTLDTQGSAVTPAASYTIYRDGTQIGTANSDVTTFNDNGLNTGTYDYTVTATDYCGNVSDASAAASATLSNTMLFPDASTPSATTASDPNPTTVGVQFTSATPSEVDGVQFYRAEGVGDGASIGVWDSSGNLLGSGDVADTTATGWVTATLQDPVEIQANATYTVGYYTPAGDYSYTAQGLYSPVSNGDLTALANGGVTHSGTGMVLPASTSNASNYYVSPVIGPRQAGGPTTNDIVFEQTQTSGPSANQSQITRRDSDGTLQNLSTQSSGYNDFYPDVSRDGSRIAFIGQRPCPDNPATPGDQVLIVMNSDGSAQSQLTNYLCPNGNNNYESIVNYQPRWSPNGQQIAYMVQDNNAFSIHTINGDGSGGDARVPSDQTNLGYELDPAWSPDGSEIAYDVIDPQTGASQLYVMNSDGSNPHLLDGSNSGYSDLYPVWSPDGNRLYFVSSQGAGVWYYTINNASFTRSSSALGGSVTPAGSGYAVSADSSTLTYAEPGGSSGCEEIYTIPASGGTPTAQTTTQYTNGSCVAVNRNPTFAYHSWASATEPLASGDAVSIDAPKASDAFLQRGIHIKLDSTGVDHWEYCWSHTASSGATPDSSCTQHLQESTNTDLNATLDYSITSPNQDWYLWVHPHNSSIWNGGGSNKPLQVHTPKVPIWVAIGDSYTSGHNQLSDEWFCPDAADNLLTAFGNFEHACYISGAPHVNRQDYTFSWVNGAVIGANENLPSQWAMQPTAYNLAISGTPTAKFGVAGSPPGSDVWASGSTQAGAMRRALYANSDSWNIVSVTGGADDTNWTDVLTEYYKDLSNIADPIKPWEVTDHRGWCTNTDKISSSLVEANSEIINNLYGLVMVAHRASPGGLCKTQLLLANGPLSGTPR